MNKEFRTWSSILLFSSVVIIVSVVMRWATNGFINLDVGLCVAIVALRMSHEALGKSNGIHG